MVMYGYSLEASEDKNGQDNCLLCTDFVHLNKAECLCLLQFQPVEFTYTRGLVVIQF